MNTYFWCIYRDIYDCVYILSQHIPSDHSCLPWDPVLFWWGMSEVIPWWAKNREFLGRVSRTSPTKTGSCGSRSTACYLKIMWYRGWFRNKKQPRSWMHQNLVNHGILSTQSQLANQRRISLQSSTDRFGNLSMMELCSSLFLRSFSQDTSPNISPKKQLRIGTRFQPRNFQDGSCVRPLYHFVTLVLTPHFYWCHTNFISGLTLGNGPMALSRWTAPPGRAPLFFSRSWGLLGEGNWEVCFWCWSWVFTGF